MDCLTTDAICSNSKFVLFAVRGASRSTGRAVAGQPESTGQPQLREKRRERISVSTTDNPDLYSMKLPELRELAIEKGLKSITALRKGELIMAI